jgi:prophage maintenance system killer protein
LVKNHSFIDGNKRIAASIFLWFLEKNALLYGPSGDRRLANATLVALTLMIAESKPRDKGPVINIVMNLITGREHQ